MKLSRTSINDLCLFIADSDSFTFRFVYGLFTDALSDTQYITLNGRVKYWILR